MVLGLLPTPSVRAVRLASRLMTSTPLTNSFWRTRFDYPNECSTFVLPERFFSRTEIPVDWKTLRERLLDSFRAGNKRWLNRQRISSLTSKLVRKVLSKDIDDAQTPAQHFQEHYTCRQSFLCGNQEPVNKESIYLSSTFSGGTLLFSFQSRRVNPTIVGFGFSGSKGSSVAGKLNEKNLYRCAFEMEEYVKGFVVGFAAEGFVGIRIIIGSNDPNVLPREQEFGSFEERVALGRLYPCENTSIVGLQAGLTKVSNTDLLIHSDSFSTSTGALLRSAFLRTPKSMARTSQRLKYPFPGRYCGTRTCLPWTKTPPLYWGPTLAIASLTCDRRSSPLMPKHSVTCGQCNALCLPD